MEILDLLKRRAFLDRAMVELAYMYKFEDCECLKR